MIGRPFALSSPRGAEIPLTRRLNDPNGAFAGVVAAGIRQAWLWDRLPTGMTIRRADGVILATAPFDPDAIGRTAAAPADRRHRPGGPAARRRRPDRKAERATRPPAGGRCPDARHLDRVIGLSGPDQMRTHPRAAMERIDLYLDRLGAPAPLPAPDDRTAHGLIRMAGRPGLTALAETPRAFDRASDRAARIQDPRETALETARALRRRREAGEGP